MNIEHFSPVRANVSHELNTLGIVIVEPGSHEHRACAELVAFGRAFKLPGSESVFAQERRIDPARR